MTGEQVYVLSLIAIAIILFVTEWISVDVTAVGILLALVFGNILPLDNALSGFANEALLTIGALFIVSEGVIRTGAVAYLGYVVERLSGGRVGAMFAITLLLVGVSSAFLNNTPVVVLFVPITLGLAQKHGFSPSKMLIPVSFASILGGTCTLIGTSTNILINSFASTYKFRPLGMFEFLPLGLPFCVVGGAYLLIFSFRWLPDRRTVTSVADPGTFTEYVTELHLLPESPSIGRTVVEAFGPSTPELRILEIIRGEQILWPPFDEIRLEAHDVLVIKGDLKQVVGLQQQKGMAVLPGAGEGVVVRGHETTLAEIVLPPSSRLVGRTLEVAQFRKHHGAAVIAVQRRGAHIRRTVSKLRLRQGDVLLVQGDLETIQGLRGERDFLLLEGAGRPLTELDTRRAPIAGAILLAVVVLAAIGAWPIALLSIAGAFAMVVSRCLSASRAYQSINWGVLVLIACMIPLGQAMGETRLVEAAGHGIQALTQGLPPGWRPYIVLSAFYLLITVASSFMSNGATAILFVPLAIGTARQLGVDERPFLFAVAFAASCAFLSPVGYQTHMIVYGPGGYRFSDFVRFGAPLNALLWIVASILLPILWPFHP